MSNHIGEGFLKGYLSVTSVKPLKDWLWHFFEGWGTRFSLCFASHWTVIFSYIRWIVLGFIVHLLHIFWHCNKLKKCNDVKLFIMFKGAKLKIAWSYSMVVIRNTSCLNIQILLAIQQSAFTAVLQWNVLFKSTLLTSVKFLQKLPSKAGISDRAEIKFSPAWRATAQNVALIVQWNG